MTDNGRDLGLTRRIRAPAALVYRCWTEPDLLRRWFAPAPFTVSHAALDVRPGGVSRIVMRGPDGGEMPNVGVYLDVVANRRLVFTDAFVEAWVPKDGDPFIVVAVTLENDGDVTRYEVRVSHWTIEARARHEAMGFAVGWGLCADQLTALAEGLARGGV